MSVAQKPPVYIVYPKADHESMKLGLGLALALSLLSLPGLSARDRDLAVSELSGVLRRMEGQ